MNQGKRTSARFRALARWLVAAAGAWVALLFQRPACVECGGPLDPETVAAVDSGICQRCWEGSR